MANAGNVLRRCWLEIVVGVLCGVAGAAPTAVAEPITLEVRDAGDTPVVSVTVGETPDPKGMRYDVSTTLGAAEAARTFHMSFTRKGSQWMFESVDGLKAGPFKKVTSVANKGGAAVSKRFKGWAKLAATPSERSALLARGKELQAEMKAEAKAMVAAVNATATFDPRDLAVSQMAIALRYYDWLYATIDAVQQLGPKDKKGVNQHMSNALDALYPRGNVGQCEVPAIPTHPPVYRMNSKDCPPSDFVPLSAIPLSQECYGKNGLYQDQDFKCSAGAPQGTKLVTNTGTVAVDFRACCLEHDRAFFCGGVTTSGQATGNGPGSWTAWQRANASLVSCISKALLDGYAAGSTTPDDVIVGGWELYFSWTGNIFIWGNSALVGDAWNNGWNAPAILNRRLDTCLCGGDQPVPLCGNHCKINQCTETPPALLDSGAFENLCANTCIWTCVEEYEDGELTKRYKRKRLFDSQGNVVDTGEDFDFSSCTPDYEMPCACVPYERPQPPMQDQCVIPSGFFDSLGLPTAQNVSQVNP